MSQELNEELMTDKEIDLIAHLLEQDSVGYFKLLRLIFVVALVVIVIVGLIASNVTPADELEKKFSLGNYSIASGSALLLLLAMIIYGKKKFSTRYRLDLKHRLKRVIALRIQQKQYVELSQTCHFHLNYPGLNSIQVSPDDFMIFQVGDVIHVEFAKYSQTYLGYF